MGELIDFSAERKLRGLEDTQSLMQEATMLSVELKRIDKQYIGVPFKRLDDDTRIRIRGMRKRLGYISEELLDPKEAGTVEILAEAIINDESSSQEAS